MSVPALERPVLIGGTGRSGTTIAARTLNHHPDLTLTRVRELRFITGRGGLIQSLGTALADGTSDEPDPTGFEERLRGRFFRWRKPSGIHAGLHRILDSETLDIALDDFRRNFDIDPVIAARTLVVDILASPTGGRPGCRWIDSTPSNVKYARALHALMPHARILHMMRDGRDVAVSFAAMNFGPNDPRIALDMWGERMMRAAEQETNLPDGVLVRVDLSEWAGPGALASLRQVCDFLQLPADPGLERWFEGNVTADAMHPGRWRRDLTARQARSLTSQYEDWCAALRERFPGITLPNPT